MTIDYTIHFESSNENFLNELTKSNLASVQPDTSIYLKDNDIDSGWGYDIAVRNVQTDVSFCYLEVVVLSPKLINTLSLCLSSSKYHIKDDDDELRELSCLTD